MHSLISMTLFLLRSSLGPGTPPVRKVVLYKERRRIFRAPRADSRREPSP
jgi:hypothetical protein